MSKNLFQFLHPFWPPKLSLYSTLVAILNCFPVNYHFDFIKKYFIPKSLYAFFQISKNITNRIQ